MESAPSSTDNESGIQYLLNLESRAWGQGSKSVLDYLRWGAYLVYAQIDTNIDSHQWLLSTLTCEESYNKADLFARLKMFGVFDFGFSMWEALIVQQNFRRHPKNLKIYLVK